MDAFLAGLLRPFLLALFMALAVVIRIAAQAMTLRVRDAVLQEFRPARAAAAFPPPEFSRYWL
jgi:hypothetical protein